MRYAQNDNVYGFTAQYATDWSSIHWYKVEKYVDKLQKRIYHAERYFGLSSARAVCSANGHVRFQRGCG